MRFRKIVHLYLFLCLPLFAANESRLWQQAKAINEEESLFLRRIADFWQEGEYGIAKKQIEEFLRIFPSSSFAEPLSIAMGDLALREKNYIDALSYYSKITSNELIEKIFLNRMQCLYYLEWYATLADECEARLEKNLEEGLALKTTYYLAISLYHQSLNAQKEPDLSRQLAQRAEPYFERLLNSELSDETAQAFAHLCCILKDFPRAAGIYLDLAQKEPAIREEMAFQAALVQAEFSKPQALETFALLAKGEGIKAQESAYNQMVLLFETAQYQKLFEEKETLLNQIPPNKKGMAHLFLGRSFLALKKHKEAADELKNFIKETPSCDGQALQSAFVSLIEASFQSDDLAGMNLALEKLSEINPSHLEISKGRFSRALLLKKQAASDRAKDELNSLLVDFSQFPLRPQAIFELAHLEYQQKNWASCRSLSNTFISEFPDSELAPFAWRYLSSSSAMLASENPEKKELKEQLILDLTSLLKQEKMFSQIERNDWQFFLSKAQFDLGELKETIKSLSSLLKEPSLFPQEPNAYLLLAICHRDELNDLESFCSLSEIALKKKADLLEIGPLHISLFNAYLHLAEQTPSFLEKAAEHLYEAFEHKSIIKEENLIWLAAYYEELFEKKKPDLSLASRSYAIYNHLLYSNNLKNANFEATSMEQKTDSSDRFSIEEELILYKLAKICSILGNTEEQIALLTRLLKTHPESEQKVEAQFLLAEGHAALGNKAMAASLYDLISQTAPPIRSQISAKAHLQGARIHSSNVLEKKHNIDHPEAIQTLSLLKDLILQKSLNNEPVHLEAALEYIDFKNALEPLALEKRISLLKKIKTDFENKEDLLSQDYHRAKEKFPEKEKIYLGYLQLMDAEILLHTAQDPLNLAEQKELQAKGKDLLLEIIEQKAHPALVSRATSRLQSTDENLRKN